MFDGVGDMLKLKTLLNNVGIEPPAGDVNGSHVLGMVEAGEWGQLELYVASDAWSEMELFIQRVQRLIET